MEGKFTKTEDGKPVLSKQRSAKSLACRGRGRFPVACAGDLPTWLWIKCVWFSRQMCEPPHDHPALRRRAEPGKVLRSTIQLLTKA